VQANRRLSSSGVSLWVESELAASTTCDISVKYVQVGGQVLATERLPSVKLPASAGRKLSAPSMLRFAPPFSSLELVLLVQLTMRCAGQPILINVRHTYTFKPTSAANMSRLRREDESSTPYVAYPNLLPTDRTNFTSNLGTLALCTAACDKSSDCKGFATDTSQSDCWTYNHVLALTAANAAGDTYYRKPSAPVPPHPPHPPSPPSPPPLPPRRRPGRCCARCGISQHWALARRSR